MVGPAARFALVAAVAASLGAPPAGAALRPRGADLVATGSVSFDAGAQRYTLAAVGPYAVAYTVDVGHAEVQRGQLRIAAAVDGGTPVVVVAGGGTRYRATDDQVREPVDYAPTGNVVLQQHAIEADAVVLRYQEQPASHQLQKTYRLRLEGVALVVEVRSDSTWGLDGYAGVSLGWAEGVAGSRVVTLPYLPEPIALLPGGEVLAAFVDPTLSSGVAITRPYGEDAAGRVFVHGRSQGEPDTTGVAAPLDETCWVTLARDLADVFPQVDAAPSPYHATLGPRVVLDVWGLHRSFSVDEGVAYAWTSPDPGAGHVTVRYADGNDACGDGVAVVVRHGDALLARRAVRNGDTQEQVFDADLALQAGDVVRAEILRAGNNSCDATALRLTVTASSGTYDSQADFSSTQGERGFGYLEVLDGAATPMTWDAANGRWQGAGAFAYLWPGGGHPGEGPTAWRDARNLALRYAEHGLSSLAIIFHVWQRWGYDAGLPDHHPANPAFGTDAELATFVGAARQAGMLVALHENYTDLYPNAPPAYPSPLYDATAIAHDRSGAAKLGWLNEGTGQQAYRIAARRMQSFAALESPAIASSYGTNAAYLDVTTGWSPGLAIDHDASHGTPPTLRDAHDATVALFAAMKGFHGGPLFGEGGEGGERFDSYFAGAVDGVERQIEGRSHAAVAPDYELLAVKPRMLNHGLGYYSRYFADEGQVTPTLAELDLDQARATQIAFGHAGFLGDSVSDAVQWVRLHAPEYYLMQALQARYAGATATSVKYHDGAAWHDLESALRAGLPLTRARVELGFASGLRVWVNRDSPRGAASSVGDFSPEQGRGGWSYLYDQGGTLAPMTWDPLARCWRGPGAYLLICAGVTHPDGGAPVRTFTAPITGTLTVRGTAQDADTSCGDGVTASIRRGAEVLWQCALPGSGATCGAFDFTVAVTAGDVLAFRVDQGATNWCDTTVLTARLSWDDGAVHDWDVATLDGAVTLPPSGFCAEDPSGFRAATRRLAGGAVVDLVTAPEYDYARSRDGASVAAGRLETNGGVAVVHGAAGDDVHGFDLSSAARDGALLLATSQRADVNLRHRDARAVLVTVRDPAAAPATDVTWGGLPDEWRLTLAVAPDRLQLRAAAADGTPAGAPLPVAYQDGAVVLAGLVADQAYLLELLVACGDGACHETAGETCASCPADCPTAADEVCCAGALFAGECCGDEACAAPATCVDHACVALDGGAGDGGVADGGGDGGPDPSVSGGCGCRAGARGPGAAGLLAGLGALGACARRRRMRRGAGGATPRRP